MVKSESMAQRAILFRSAEKEKKGFLRSGNDYVCVWQKNSEL